MHVLVTRAEPDATDMQDRLMAAGHRVTVAPLIGIEAVDAGSLDLDGVQALIATSRNAMRCVSARADLQAALGLPLIAVGPGTAEAARHTGFTRVTSGAGAARDLPALITTTFDPAAGSLLHLAGETLAFDLAGALRTAGFDTRVHVVYRSRPLEQLAASTEQLLQIRAIDGVTLMSPQTAGVYAELVARHGLTERIAPIVHLCLSAAVAARLAPLGPVEIAVAHAPNLEEMLALVARVAAQSRQ